MAEEMAQAVAEAGNTSGSRRPRPGRLVLIACATVYLIALALHGIVQLRGPSPQPPAAPGDLSIWAWPEGGERSGSSRGADAASALGLDRRLGQTDRVCILLHGSPGSGAAFEGIARELERRGIAAIAADLPGFGFTPTRDDISTRAHAADVLALLDRLGVERAHVVGWSMGGGVALNMADLAPERVASIVMLGAVGGPETESSGSPAFEWLKYRAAELLLGPGMELIPHFGLLGTPGERTRWVQNFDQTDFAEHRRIMTDPSFRGRVPVLVLNGLTDQLVPAWAAERHHLMLPNSELVMLDNPEGTFAAAPLGHFTPITDARRSGAIIAGFIDAVAAGPPATSLEGVREVVDRGVPEDLRWSAPPRSSLHDALLRMFATQREAPFWLAIVVIAVLAWMRPETTTVICGLIVGATYMDFALALTGLTAGRLWRERFWILHGGRPESRPRGVLYRWAAPVLWQTAALTMITQAGHVLAFSGELYRPGPLIFALLVLPVALHIVRLLPTWRGRRRLLAGVHRVFAIEFWPGWAMYAPIAPYLVYRAIDSALRPGPNGSGPLTWTCCNPAISGHGGIATESKSQILEQLALGQDAAERAGNRPLSADGVLILPWQLVDGPPKLRAERAIEAVESIPALGGYPVICKPDNGYRGYAVRLCRDDAELRAATELVPGAVQLQRYHPGPREAGILWVRGAVAAAGTSGGDVPEGYLFAITRKTFPEVIGDGRRTLERLILDDARLRCQADMFLARHAGMLGRVIDDGLVYPLGRSGNHAQGCLFTDGSDLMTAELAVAIDRLLAPMPPLGSSGSGVPGAGGFDCGRLDVRYESEAELRCGRGFAVVELNGTTSEPTNIYDPTRPPGWAWATLASYWSEVFRLGAERRAMGVDPITISRLIGLLRTSSASRRAPVISD